MLYIYKLYDVKCIVECKNLEKGAKITLKQQIDKGDTYNIKSWLCGNPNKYKKLTDNQKVKYL